MNMIGLGLAIILFLAGPAGTGRINQYLAYMLLPLVGASVYLNRG